MNGTDFSPPAAVASEHRPSAAGVEVMGCAAADPRAVDDWVARQIRNAYGVAHVPRDDDGDIPIPFGDCIVFVRSYEAGTPFVELHSLLLAEFDMTPRAYEAVNAINAQTSLPKVMVDAGARQIYMESWLLIDHLTAHDLIFAIEFMGDAATHFAPLLQQQLGGRLLLEPPH